MEEFRRRHIPVDNIVQDWNYWKLDSWGDHTFEPSRYPNPQAMLDSVHAMHGRFMISVWPKFYDTVRLRTKEAPQREQVAKETGTGAAAGARAAKRQPVKKAQKPGRNDPCPCGSGKKYKKCCGRDE